VPEARQPLLQGAGELLQRNARSVTGLLLVALLVSTVYVGKLWLSDPHRFPLSVVEVKGDFRYLGKQQLQEAVAPYATGGFFTVDVAAIRSAAEALPWVHKASVKRVWPETLRLQIEEQQPVARWGEQGFLNKGGEPFVPRQAAVSLQLPLLAGPDGHELKVLENYQRVSKTLAPLGVKVTRMELDNRRAWHLQLDDAVLLELGRADDWQRLQRFVRAWPVVFAGRQDALQRVDLRYSNGFSVYWDRTVLEDAGGKQG
jgi:cell division protein FtsQ